jgi:hypothetical protein
MSKQLPNCRREPAGRALAQRSLGDFDEFERQGFPRERALTRQDQQPAKPLSGAMREQLAREDTLGLHVRQGRPCRPRRWWRT